MGFLKIKIYQEHIKNCLEYQEENKLDMQAVENGNQAGLDRLEKEKQEENEFFNDVENAYAYEI